MINDEELLAGAGKGREVWRVGNTVRRTTGPWTPAVHALLRHLEEVGFDAAPRVLGVDDQGREVLQFVEGTEGRNVRHDLPTLTAVGRLVRAFHDAVRDFEPPAGSVWRTPRSSDGSAGHIICHHDLAPYNTIYRSGQPVAFIDWDLAGPAPAIEDVAHAAWTFVPLYTDEDCARIGLPICSRGSRLRRFCDGYGLQDRDGFLDRVRAHLHTLDSNVAKRSIPFLDAHRHEWEHHLE